MSRGKIAREGFLFRRVLRSGEVEYIKQECPVGFGSCSDSCPLFGDIEIGYTRVKKVHLCNGIVFEIEEDQREEK